MKNEIVDPKKSIPLIGLTIEKKEKALFGAMRGTIRVQEDIVSTIDEDWDADS